MKDVLKKFSGKRVLVTGHTGFKGSWLALILSHLGAEVTGYALAPVEDNNHFDSLNLCQSIRHVIGDIRDLNSLLSTFKTCKPEFVFHLAAQALVKHSYNQPIDTFSTNMMGSANVLESVRQESSVRSLVYITSDKCYENNEWIWGYRENDRLGGFDPYSASKAAAEVIFSAYSRSFFSNRADFGAATARAGNVIGGGDWAKDRIVPDCIRAIRANTPLILRNPTATRPWQHVLEPLSGYLKLAMHLFESPSLFTGSWNFGPSSVQPRTVLEVAKCIFDTIGQGEIVVSDEIEHQHEAQLLQLNCDKANQILMWHPRWDVNSTLQQTADWYQAVLSGGNVKDVTMSQIKQYFHELK